MLTDQSQMRKLKVDERSLGLSDKIQEAVNNKCHQTPCYFVECGVAL